MTGRRSPSGRAARTVRPRSPSAALLAVLLAFLCTLCPLPGLAASGSTNAQLRVACFSPDGPNLDVYIDGARAVSDLAYKVVSPYQSVSAGNHRIELRAAGAEPGSSPLARNTASVVAGSYYTAAAAGKAAQLEAVLFSDGFTPPALGKAAVRAIHFAPEVPTFDIAVKGGPVIFKSVGFPSATSYSAVEGGTYDLEFRAAGSDQVLLAAPGVTLKPGMVESLAGVGGVGKPIEVVQIPDAAGVAASGGASTGLGGMAGPRLPRLPALLEVALVLGIVGAALWVGRRRFV